MSEEEKQGISINFGLKFFEILDYVFDNPKEEIEPKDIRYRVQFKPNADLDNETFSIGFKIISQLGDNEGKQLGSIHTRTTYSLSNMDDLINEDGHFVLPKGLAITLLSIALSTTRGALVAKSENNILSKVVLPLTDPKEMYEASPLKGEIEIK